MESAWGIIVTALTLVGMLGLVIFTVSEEEPSSSPYPESAASEAVAERRAA